MFYQVTILLAFADSNCLTAPPPNIANGLRIPIRDTWAVVTFQRELEIFSCYECPSRVMSQLISI